MSSIALFSQNEELLVTHSLTSIHTYLHFCFQHLLSLARNLNLGHLGKVTAAAPFLPVCAALWVQTMEWLPVLGILIRRTDADGCDGTLGLYKHCKSLHWKWLWEKSPLSHQGIEPMSVLILVFGSDALPAKLSRPYTRCSQLKHPFWFMPDKAITQQHGWELFSHQCKFPCSCCTHTHQNIHIHTAQTYTFICTHPPSPSLTHHIGTFMAGLITRPVQELVVLGDFQVVFYLHSLHQEDHPPGFLLFLRIRFIVQAKLNTHTQYIYYRQWHTSKQETPSPKQTHTEVWDWQITPICSSFWCPLNTEKIHVHLTVTSQLSLFFSCYPSDSVWPRR